MKHRRTLQIPVAWGTIENAFYIRAYMETEPPFNRPFWSSPRPLYQNEIKCSVFDVEMIFHSHANKTHFHKKGCALDLILKVRGLCMAYSFLSRLQDKASTLFLGYLRPCVLGEPTTVPDPQTSTQPTMPHLPHSVNHLEGIGLLITQY